ncbi:HEPN domain-containing protein [Nostoc sp.]|uniref:ApeA N-terminal domain 1-containing protein n=1 Tax=Nostoc sp. TaxID=1180 RepID=UPI002FF8AC9A
MEEFEFLGSWWLPSNPQQEVTGTVKFSSENGISLEIVGSLNEQDFLDIDSESQEIIIGVTHGQLFTLLNCRRNTSKRSVPGILTQRFNVHYALVGYHFNNSEQIKFDKFQVGFTDLKYLSPLLCNLNLNSNSNSNGDYQEYQLFCHVSKDLKANITKANISINQFIEQQITNQEVTVTKSALITVDIKEKKSIDEIYSQFIDPLTNFITLAANRSNYITQLFFILDIDDSSQRIKAIFRNSNYINKTDILRTPEALLTLDDIKEHFSLVMQRWFNLFDEAQDIINLYFSTIYNPNLYQENKFLSLVQTLESYHRRKVDRNNSFTEEHSTRLDNILAVTPIEHRDWVKEKLKFSHEPSLLERLREVFELTSKTIEPIVIDSKSFTKKVKNIRNHLTHYNDPSQQELYDGETLFRINQILDFMIKVCLLQELGCSSERCEELICRNPEYKFLKNLMSKNHKIFL